MAGKREKYEDVMPKLRKVEASDPHSKSASGRFHVLAAFRIWREIFLLEAAS
jgi:hypothetical protein